MLSRPFLPFRVRPLHENKVRPSPLQTADILDALDDLKPFAVKAERRPMKATPLLVSGRPPRPLRFER
jgi:hypothetical protein